MTARQQLMAVQARLARQGVQSVGLYFRPEALATLSREALYREACRFMEAYLEGRYRQVPHLGDALTG